MANVLFGVEFANVKDYRRALRAVGKNISFATSQALNDTALHFQLVQQLHQLLTYEIRVPNLFENAVKIRRQDRATKANLQAVVWIDDRVRKKNGTWRSRRPDIWGRMELYDKRFPKAGNEFIAIPREKDGPKRTGRGLIRKREFPSQLQQAGRSFIVDFKGGDAGIFVRTGRRRKSRRRNASTPRKRLTLKEDPNVRFLYYLASDPPDLDNEFDWEENATIAFDSHFEGAMRKRLAAAFADIKVK